jgi:ABC-type glycerol-3-phosphate transport system substrate-binding protein
LYYDKQLFEAADLPLPENDWTIDEFVLALRELESVTGGPPLWFDFNRFTPWEALIVASGAMPLDYSTEPPTFQLTDEDVFPAVKQVFDLSKEGLIAYKEMATFFGFGAREEYDPAIESKLLNFLNLQYELTTHGLVNFPRGTEQVPVMFYVTGSNIHADTEHPEACYRLLQHMTQVSPRLLRGMPAYHDVLETEQTRAAFGDDTVQTFLDFAERVESPQAVYLDSGAVIRGPGMFLGRAFDRYMMNDADLLAELEQAEAYIEDYRACTSADDYAGDVIGCILQVDPSMRDEFEPRNLRGR